MRELLRELVTAQEQQRPLVFCSLVETRGSTPQKAGAGMLVYADGSQFGTLGGGCVEAEVKRQALRVLQEDQPQPQQFRFCLDDDYGWDDGLICGGRMTVLADPLKHSNTNHYFRQLYQLLEMGIGGTEVLPLQENPLQLPVGSRFLFDANNRLIDQQGSTPLPHSVLEQLPSMMDRPQPFQKQQIAYLPILPRITLLIVGGGHVGQAVAQLASQVDFDVWVLDDRDKFITPERFPTAKRRICGDLGQTLKELAPTLHPNIYTIIVTRGHNHDEEALYHLCQTKAGYVGMIGSKRKIRLIFEDLINKGIAEETLNQVHAPLGLPIGSQTVPEIAISIVAELIACRNKR